MKNVLDLLEEYCRLNDMRNELDGRLSQRSERRWRDLKALYDRVMAPILIGDGPSIALIDDVPAPPGRLLRRTRLRVPTDMHVFFRHEEDHFASQVLNLSRGGLFLRSTALLAKGAQITIYLPNMDCNYGELFETQAEVTWNTVRLPGPESLRGMGVRFFDIGGVAAEQLDAFIIELLDTRLAQAG